MANVEELRLSRSSSGGSGLGYEGSVDLLPNRPA